MKKFITPVAVIISLTFTSCATLFTGTKQSIQVNSIPPGATVQIDGVKRGITPARVRVKKGMEGPTITLKSDGYDPTTFQPETTFNAVSVLNLLNILFWGVDVATGALWKYDPKYYEIEMSPVKPATK